jgi:LysM repeat protein
MSTYTIQKGDTFSAIATKLSTNVQTLENLNPGVNPDDLQIGQVINVPGTGSTYKIVKGDTFSSIAAKLGTNVQTLENLNPGLNPDDLQIGQVINIPGTPGTSTYTIMKGDTLSSIASRLGTNVQTLENLNPSVNPNDLQIGQVIIVPAVPGPSPPPAPNGYVSYSGPASAFPDESTWADYNSLWAFNSTIIPNRIVPVPEDVGSSISIIGFWIPAIAAEYGVDPRVILCIIMQESDGDVLVNSTTSPPPANITNTGIMQAHDGATLDTFPWPAQSIEQMIRDGTNGTASGPDSGLAPLFNKYKNWYEVARAYNSGSVNQEDLSDGLGATPSYVSDVANRLQGHVWSTQ